MNLKNAGRTLLMGIAALLLLGAGVSIWALEKVGRLSAEAALEGQKVERLLMTGARVQTDFQVQIQEFKNVLLRGEDIDLFKKHFEGFKKRRDAVQEGLDEMSQALELAGMDKTPAEQLLLAHSELSFRYGEAAKLVKGMGIAASAEADKSVRGIDRETSKGLTDLRAAIDAYAAKRAEERAAAIAATTSTARQFMLGMTLLGGLAVLLSVHLGLRRLLALIGGEPHDAVQVFSRIAAGDLTTPIPNADVAGSLMAELGCMQQQLRQRTEAEHRAAEETLRIKRALDNAGASIMLVNLEGKLLYTNQAMQQWLLEHGQVLGVQPGSALSIADVLANTSAAAWVASLAERDEGGRLDFEVAGLSLALLVQGVFADDGHRIGHVVEWQDHTAGVVAERQIESLIEAVLRGDFSHRVPLEGKQGFHRKSAEGLNNLAKVMAEVLADVGGVLNALANGDLTRKIGADYQGTLGQLKNDTNTTVDRLREIVSQLQSASNTINMAAGEIASGNADLSRYTEAQASALEETSSSMEELNSTVRQNADNAKQANQLARDSNKVASVGGERMAAMVTTMSDIQQASHRIEAIIGVIDSIAFQTNILALNAAVEAARAGEQGRGFAVVASEVRNLAKRSAEAAQEIKRLIADSVSKVGGGVKLVQQAGSTMQQMVADFNRLSGLVTDIAEASGEQSAGIEQVTQAISQMDEAMQQNAARVEEAAAAAVMLTEQSADLDKMVKAFRVEGGMPALVPALVPAAPRPASIDKRPAPVAQLTVRPQEKAEPVFLEDEWAEF